MIARAPAELGSFRFALSRLAPTGSAATAIGFVSFPSRGVLGRELRSAWRALIPGKFAEIGFVSFFVRGVVAWGPGRRARHAVPLHLGAGASAELGSFRFRIALSQVAPPGSPAVGCRVWHDLSGFGGVLRGSVKILNRWVGALGDDNDAPPTPLPGSHPGHRDLSLSRPCRAPEMRVGIGVPGLTPRAVIWTTPSGFSIVAGGIIRVCCACTVRASDGEIATIDSSPPV